MSTADKYTDRGPERYEDRNSVNAGEVYWDRVHRMNQAQAGWPSHLFGAPTAMPLRRTRDAGGPGAVAAPKLFLASCRRCSNDIDCENGACLACSKRALGNFKGH